MFIQRLRQGWSAVSPEARAILLIAVIGFLRLLWLSDMEFKGDERYTAEYLATLGSRPFTPATEPSGHSGVSLSNGFYYFLNAFPVNYGDPLNIIAMIAGLNAAAIAFGLWILRKSKAGFLAFALIGTSIALIQGSRKIWYPDLVPFWTNLGLAFFLCSREVGRPRIRMDLLIAASAFCFAVAGHMYMPGLMIGGCASGVALLIFLLRRDWRSAASWTAGLLLAAVTWLPYLIFMFSGSGAYGHSAGGIALDWKLLEPILRHVLTLPSTFPFSGLYLRSIRDWINSNYGPGQPHEQIGEMIYFSFHLTRGVLFAAGVLGVAIFWGSLAAFVKKWKEAILDPLLATCAAMLVLISAALFVTRLGSYLHYWLGVMPFAFYGIAWAATREEWPRFSPWLRRLAWTSCVLSVIGALGFAVLVHQQRGLPGEYGPSYSSRRH